MPDASALLDIRRVIRITLEEPLGGLLVQEEGEELVESGRSASETKRAVEGSNSQPGER